MTDDELLEIVSEFRSGILGDRMPTLMCAAVCWPLASYLSVFHNIETEAVESDLGDMNHVWLRLPDGRALDPTASQFNYLDHNMGLPDVYLGKPLSIHPL